MPFLLLLALILIGAPESAEANVRINEIAWMGSADNPNAEWIELYNDSGEAVALAGWAITSSTGAPTIALTGTIAPQGFYLLTRTSTSLIPGVQGDQAYTGALSNAGATLTLSQGSVVVETVAGGANWESIGGSNETKETAQRQGSTWVTAPATPKAATLEASGVDDEEEVEVAEETATTTPTATIGGSTTTSGVSSYTFPRLYLIIGADRLVTARAATPFSAFVFDEKASRRNADVSWAFGDGVRKSGERVTHAYAVAGEYLVVARATHKSATAIRTLTVRAVPAEVAIMRVPGVGIEIQNASNEPLDLSRWQLSSGGRRFTIPEDTAILPRGKSIFTYSVTKLREGEEAVLYFPDGSEAARDGALASAAL